MSGAAADWTWWRMALAGHRQSVTMGKPEVGYYRRKFKATKTRPGSDDPVAIWLQADGSWRCRVGDRDITDVDHIFDVFQSCCKTPVTYEHYKHVIEHKVWPTDLPDEVAAKADAAVAEKPAAEPVAGIGHNSGDEAGPSKHELAVDAVNTAKKAFADWLAAIGGTIITQDQADLAAEYRDRATKLEARADEVRKDEKQPHLDAGRAVDDKWRGVIADAAALKVTVRNAVEVFLKAEKARLQQEALAAAQRQREEAAAAAARAAEERGIDPPPAEPAPVAAPPPEVTVRAGAAGTRKTGLRTVARVRIDDIEKVKQAFIATAAGAFAAREWAEKTGPSAPIPIPGTTQYVEDVAR